MHQSNPTAPPPPGTAGHYLPCHSGQPGSGTGHLQILRGPGSGICLPRGHLELLARTWFPIVAKITKHGGIYWKYNQISRLAYQIGREKLVDFFQEACFST